MKLLVVEDDIQYCETLDYLFQQEDIHATFAHDGTTAKKEFFNNYELILLDCMLPDTNGIDLLKYLRKENPNIPVIIITALGSLTNKLDGFNNGADDYIVKPFAMDELMARMEMVLRRAGKGGHQLQAFDVTLDSAAHLVLQRGQPVELTPREFALLETLMRNRGAAVYRDTLMERAWGGDAECTRAVDTYITRLRKKLDWGDKIETVYQIGYRLKLE